MRWNLASSAFVMGENSLFENLFLVGGLILLAWLVSTIWTTRTKTDDGVSDEADSMYTERDVIGQPKDWRLTTNDDKKSVLPGLSTTSVLS